MSVATSSIWNELFGCTIRTAGSMAALAACACVRVRTSTLPSRSTMTYSVVLTAAAESGLTATEEMTTAPAQKARNRRVIVTL